MTLVERIQKLKAKKGFTLVELIVVIAILAILMAILIPTMLNFTEDAKITSANNTATQIRTNTNSWLTKLDTAGTPLANKDYGDSPKTIVFTVKDKGDWKPASSTLAQSDFKGTLGDPADLLVDYLDDILSDSKNMQATVYFNEGKVLGVCVVPVAPEPSGETNVTFPDGTIFTEDGYDEWVDEKPGKFKSGNEVIIVGCAPEVGYKAAATS